MYDVTLSRVRATIVAVEKRWLLHSLSVCICSLKISSMQCACAMLSSVACPALHFFTLSHKRHEYRKKVTEHKMCVLILSTNFVWNISYSKKKWARYDKKIYTLIFMQSILHSFLILMKLEFSHRFSEKKSSNMEFRENLSRWSPAAWCGRTDRRTDMTKLTVAFRNFAITPKNQHFVLIFSMISTMLPAKFGR